MEKKNLISTKSKPTRIIRHRILKYFKNLKISDLKTVKPIEYHEKLEIKD